METTINIHLSQDFNTLCCIYQIKPEFFLQTVVDQISFPSYYSNPIGNDRWATFCFLNFLQQEESNFQVDEDLEDKYLDLLDSSINYNLHADPEVTAKSLTRVKGIMKEWQKAVLAERTKYITDHL